MDERLKGAVVVASVSGGKDSAALSLWLTEQGIEHRRVFADTGWEHELTYEYLRGPLTRALGPIDEVAGPLKMRDLIIKKGMFPSRRRRFCTEDLKVRPILKFVEAVRDAGDDVINAVGIRAAESEARSKLEEWEWSDAFDCWVWRPLIAWTEQQVIDIHKKHGLAPNPLYLKGAQRVGCFPCIFARKAEVRLVADLAPERIEEIRTLEVDVTKAAVARMNARETLGELTAEEAEDLREFLPRTFFHGKLSREGKPFPIDTIVEWSKTSRGGSQFKRLHIAEVRAPANTVAFAVQLPKREEFNKPRHGYYPAEATVDQKWTQAIATRWRNLLLVLKGKFAAIESGVETFEEAFFVHLQVPGGGTVGEHVMPRYQQAIASPGTPLLGSGR